MACNDEVVMVLKTKRNPQVWKHFDLCLMTNSHEMAHVQRLREVHEGYGELDA
ncbi:hypothetical protein Hanom_Chr05g00462751 [Helianthus anomalus]